MPDAAPPPDPNALDPVYASSRREAIQILIIWGTCLLWTIGYCRWAAYDVPPGELTTVLGVPSWVMWGIVFPWVAAAVASIGFALFVIEENPQQAGAESEGQRAEERHG